MVGRARQLNRSLPRWLVLCLLMLPLGGAHAALELTPITWDIVGLDSNRPTEGPKRFPVGAEVCNTGASALANVKVDFVWDSQNQYIDLVSGSLDTVTIASLGASDCTDVYFEVWVTPVSGAYETARRYYIEATDGNGSGSVTGTTPQPRQLYVEKLISQNRNGTITVRYGTTVGGLTAVPPGAGLSLSVGETYFIELSTTTATQGYNQLESFLTLPNTVFQVLSVESTYSANSGGLPQPNPRLWADACGWQSNPTLPTYSSCVGGDGKAGGNVTVLYEVKILSGGGSSLTLNGLVYDQSGSSFHYNADFTSAARTGEIISPTIDKAFSPSTINPGDSATLTFTLTNPDPANAVSGVQFTDPFPSNLVVAGTPNATYNSCGSGTLGTLNGGETSLSFTGGSIAANGTCTITVDVTSSTEDSYVNTTDNLFVNSTEDTGDNATATLLVADAPACVPGQTLVEWTIPSTAASPPDDTGTSGTPSINNTGYTATASAAVPGSAVIASDGETTNSGAWDTYGYKNGGQYVQLSVDTRRYQGVQMSLRWERSSPGPTDYTVSYSTDGSSFTEKSTGTTPAPAVWSTLDVDFTGQSSLTGPTYIRIAASGANNDQSGADLLYDFIRFTGCRVPAPPPTISKSFGTDPILVDATSTLTFTLTNTTADNEALTGVAFTDELPTGLEIGTGGTTNTCGGTLTAVEGTTTIDLASASLAADATCTITVPVLGTASGDYTNISGAVSSAESGPNTGGANVGYAEDTLTVIAPPELTKGFNPGSIFTDDTSTLTFSVSNPNTSTALTGVAFTDNLPTDVSVETPNGLVGPTCSVGTITGQTITAIAGSSSISLSGAELSAGAACTFSVDVTGTSAGTKNNTTLAVTSDNGGTGETASGSLIVADQTPSIDLTKQVSTDQATWTNFVAVDVGDPVYYRFKVYNSGDLAFTALSLTDQDLSPSPSCTWNPVLPLAPGAETICTYGSVTAVDGLIDNTATVTGTSSAADLTSPDSTASYGTSALFLAKEADRAQFNAAAETITYSFTVTNIGQTAIAGPVTIDDDLTIDESCPAIPGGSLDPGEQIVCTATYDTTATDVTNGSVTNTATATAVNGGNPVESEESTNTVDYATPTRAFVSGLRAYLLDGLPVIEWKTFAERGTLGYEVQRAIGDGDFMTISDGRLPALVGAPRGGVYYLADPGVQPRDRVAYRLIEHEVRRNGAIRERRHGPYSVRVLPRPPADVSIDLADLVAGDDFLAVAHRPTLREQARSRAGRQARRASKARRGVWQVGERMRGAAPMTAARAPTATETAGPAVAKLLVDEPGLYRVTAFEIAGLLGIDARTARKLIRRHGIALKHQGRDVPYRVFPGRGVLYFYNPGHSNHYTDTNVFWLYRKRNGGVPMDVRRAVPVGARGEPRAEPTGSETFSRTVVVDENLAAITNGMYGPDEDYWVSGYIRTDRAGYESLDVALRTPDAGSGEAVLTVSLAGWTADSHRVTASINGTAVGAVDWYGKAAQTMELRFDAGLLQTDNTLILSAADNQAPNSLVYINRVSVTYPSLYRVDDGRLAFDGSAYPAIGVDGFSTRGIVVLDVTEPTAPVWLRAKATRQGDGSYGTVIVPSADDRAYWAAEAGAVAPVQEASIDARSALKTTDYSADYIVIATDETLDAAQALADHRSAQFETLVVNLEDILDEYRGGLRDPEAIRDFLRDAYLHWSTPPLYAVLAGSGSYDYKDYLGHGDSLIPTVMVETPWGLTASDSHFGDVVGEDGVPEVIVGRVTAVNGTELQAYVDKIIAYEMNVAGPWAQQVVMAADDPDPAGDFTADIRDLSALVTPAYEVTEILLEDYPGWNWRAASNPWVDALNAGSAYYAYMGHGANDVLADEGLLIVWKDVDGLTNAERLPVGLFLTCSAADFAVPGFDSLGEALVLRPTGGMAAVWGSSGDSLNSDAKVFGEGFFEMTFGQGAWVLGESVRAAHENYGPDGSRFMHNIYNTLGDVGMMTK